MCGPLFYSDGGTDCGYCRLTAAPDAFNTRDTKVREGSTKDISSFAPDRKPAHPDARFVDDHDRAAFERFTDCGKIRNKQSGLTFRPAFCSAPKKYQRGSALGPQREQRAEIGIGGYDDPVFTSSACKNVRIFRRLHSIFVDMDGLVAFPSQLLRHVRRKRVVHQEPHGSASGNSRSRTASAAYLRAS